MKELIFKEAAINAIMDEASTKRIIPVAAAIKRLEILSPVQLGQEWVPCSERLPNEGEEVFVYLFGDSPYVAWIEDGKWKTEDFQIEKDDEPQAWMLPRLYKGEE